MQCNAVQCDEESDEDDQIALLLLSLLKDGHFVSGWTVRYHRNSNSSTVLLLFHRQFIEIPVDTKN
jgi:hypothetical protein